jgi:hypothetical protein
MRQSERGKKSELRIHMTNAQLKKLVNEAVALHREIVAQSERLKIMKADLVREARLHENDFTPTNNGGSRWTATGSDGWHRASQFPRACSRAPH